MSPPHDIARDDQRLVDYLLDRLPPDAAERLDEAAISDDDVADRLRIVEHDLVDAYVRGSLDGRTRARFESHYLASPVRREQVRFAGKFARAVDRAAQAAEPEHAPEPAPAPAPVAVRSRPWLLLSLAATIMLLVASGGLLLQTLRLGRGLTVAQNERTALAERTRELERQLADARAATAAAAGQVERRRADTPAPVKAAALALVLLPQTRAAGS